MPDGESASDNPPDAESSPETVPGGKNGSWYSYAIVRAVPRVDRGEYLNVGVILFARTLNYLDCRIELDEARLKAIAPDVDLPKLRSHLETFQQICDGNPAAGPIAGLSQSERFHWLTSPRSTMIQPSPAHAGRCDEPAVALQELMDEFVR